MNRVARAFASEEPETGHANITETRPVMWDKGNESIDI